MAAAKSSLKMSDLVDSDVEVHDGWTIGGLDDTDEEVNQQAAHASPVRERQWLTSAVSIS
jgi:hypothetical protein